MRGLPLKFFRDPQYDSTRLIMLKEIQRSVLTCPDISTLTWREQDYIIEEIETVCYRHTCSRALQLIQPNCGPGFKNSYMYTVYNITAIIDPDSVVSDARYLEQILADPHGFDYSWLIDAPAHRLHPEKYQDVRDKCARIAAVQRIEKFSKLQTCAKCKQDKVRLAYVINRSADEGRNQRAECQFCGHSWNC